MKTRFHFLLQLAALAFASAAFAQPAPITPQNKTVLVDPATGAVVFPANFFSGNAANLAGAAPVQSVAGRTGAVTLTSADLTDTTAFTRGFLAAVDAAAARTALGLGNVDNTSDAAKPISTATQSALNLKANLASPALTGTPTAPTAAPDTNTTQIATTAYAKAEADAAQAYAIQRANHTGTQLWSTLTGTPTTLSGYGITDGVTTARTISTTAPLSGGGNLSANRTITIADAAADGTTKGAASFTAADFNSSSGLISIDYTNAQKASSSQHGFLSSTDWSTFNGKQAAGNYITALTGDVAASGPGSVNATIQADAVTNAKLANMANGTIKGRATSGTGDPEDLTAAQVRALIGANFASIQAKSASFTVTTSDRGALFLVTTGTNEIVPTLPSAGAAGAGFYFYVLKTDATVGYIYFSTGSPANNPLVSTQNQLGLVFSTGATWIFTPLGFGFFEENSYGIDNARFWVRGPVGGFDLGIGYDGIIFQNGNATIRDENDGVAFQPRDRIIYDQEGNATVNADTATLRSSYRGTNGAWTALQVNEEELWPAMRLETVRPGANVTAETYQNRITTTNATVTTVHTVQVASASVVALHGFVVAHRTGGTSGAADDGAGYEVKFVAKNTGGTASLIGSATVTTIGESQAGWDVTVTTNADTVLIRVTGAANNNVTWHFTGSVHLVSS